MANKGGAERRRGARRDRTEKLALINKGGERGRLDKSNDPEEDLGLADKGDSGLCETSGAGDSGLDGT